MKKNTNSTYKTARHLKRALQKEVWGLDGGLIGFQDITLDAVIRLHPERREDILRTLRTLHAEEFIEYFEENFNGWTIAAGQIFLPSTAHVCALLDGRKSLPDNIF